MMRTNWLLGIVLILATLIAALIASVSLSAKGITTKITIQGVDLISPIEITDPGLLATSLVWAGPGVRGGAVEQSEGFIIDWRSGVVMERPRGLQQYQVSFYAGADNRPVAEQKEHLAYVVLYESDGSGEYGYVYLPGKADKWYDPNTRTILRGHGFEGNWFRATSTWQRAVASLVVSVASKH